VIQSFDCWPKSGVHGSAFSKDNTVLYAAGAHGNAIWTQPIDPVTGERGAPIDIAIGPYGHTELRHVILHTSEYALYDVMEGSNEMG